MLQILNILSDEHKNILTVIDFLNRECDSLESGKEIDNALLKQIIEFIRNYADRFHHAKEEDLLFKEMCSDENSENLHCNPVEQMLYEHDLGRNYVKEFEHGLIEKNRKKIIENARGYCSLLREHIFKEDNILYPMAEQTLNEKTKKKLIEKFIQIEAQKKTEKERYLVFVNKLKKLQNE